MNEHQKPEANSVDPDTVGPNAQDAVDLTRRGALERLGKYAAYTAPIMLTMLASEQAVAQTLT
jgi:hypothetical protein